MLGIILFNGCTSYIIDDEVSFDAGSPSETDAYQYEGFSNSVIAIEEQELPITNEIKPKNKEETVSPKENYEVDFTDYSKANSQNLEATEDLLSRQESIRPESFSSTKNENSDSSPEMAQVVELRSVKDNFTPAENKTTTATIGNSEIPPRLKNDKKILAQVEDKTLSKVIPAKMDSIVNEIHSVPNTADFVISKINDSEISEKNVATVTTKKSGMEVELAKLPGNLKEKIVDEIKLSKPLTLKPRKRVEYGSVSGKVSIIAKKKEVSPENVMIVVKPLGDQIVKERVPKTHIVQMKGKKYLPRYSIIQRGDSVIFKNMDPFMHNVFSLAGANKFDLGTYGKRVSPQHTFEHEGIVNVYCNIHPTMACYIMVSSNDWGLITGKDGAFEFESLPSGSYELQAWSIRGKFFETIEIEPAKNSSIEILIQSSKTRKKQHLNKHGKKYPKKSFDEFYQ